MRASRSKAYAPILTVLCCLVVTGPYAIATPSAPAVTSYAPILQPPVDMWVVPGSTAHQTLIASDADAQQLQFSVLSGPPFMDLVTRTHSGSITAGDMYFSPGPTDIGTATVGVSVTDGFGGVDQDYFVVSTQIVPRPASGLIDFETPQFTGQRRTIDPYVDPGTGVVFTGIPSGGFGAEVGLVANNSTSVCVPGTLRDQKLGSSPLGSDAAGLSGLPIRADFRTALLPPCTVSVEFQTGAGAGVRLQLFDELGNVVGSASGTAGPGLEPCNPGWGSGALARLTATSLQPVLYAVMDEPSGGFVFVVDDFEYSSAPAEAIVDLDLAPRVLNLKSHAPWITAYIEPSGFAPADIDLSTVRLLGSVAPVTKFATIGDHDRDGAPDLMLKFSRELLDPLLTPGLNTIELTGKLATGGTFRGADSVRVIDPPDGSLRAAVSPNPLNPAGVLTFSTTRPGAVTVRMFDLQGRTVRVLMEAPLLPAGFHELRIDGRSDGGEGLASGLYFYRVETVEGTATGRVAVLK